MQCTYLASRYVNKEVAREKEAPSSTAFANLFRLVYCHQPLYTYPPGGPYAFYVTLLQNF